MINKSIQIEKGVPGYAAVNSNTNLAYISYTSSNFIIVINLEKGTIENKIKATRPRDIFVNNDTNKVYIASAWGIYEIDGLNNNFELMKASSQNSKELQYASPSSLNPRGSDFDRDANRKYVANHQSKSISVIDLNQPDKASDIIELGRGKWGDTGYIDPSFVLVNDLSKVLYVKMHWIATGGGGGSEGDRLIAIDINTKKWSGAQNLPRHGQVGFAFNRISNRLYIKKSSGKTILKLDPFLKEIRRTTLEKIGFWKRLAGVAYEYFGEVIAVNTSTNKVYVSDSKNNLLCEIDG